MATDLQKINVKFYLADDAVLSPEDAFRIFSGWIPETTDEVLIDVADYQHVPRGPKTVLVGHEANYTLDDGDGRLGLLYGRKSRTEGSNAERLRAAVVAALRACRRLETAQDASAAPRFVGSEAVLVANDRLHASNDDATLDAVRGDLESLLHELYGGAQTTIQREGDDSERFTVRVRVQGDFATEALLANLGG
jgi:hypothetical protein